MSDILAFYRGVLRELVGEYTNANLARQSNHTITETRDALVQTKTLPLNTYASACTCICTRTRVPACARGSAGGAWPPATCRLAHLQRVCVCVCGRVCVCVCE